MSDTSPRTKVAVITGASSGIGKTTAITFAKAGWSVLLFARRADRLQETVSECPDAEKTLVVQGDVTDEATVERLFEDAVARFGRVDVLFNHPAGTPHPALPSTNSPSPPGNPSST
ncbi:hypothetical protein BC629DRAFT_1600646 [Irpex lacteus]|nr:hypothetical protein BC629DRAFT_1600646 [Irpex lacteus]